MASTQKNRVLQLCTAAAANSWCCSERVLLLSSLMEQSRNFDCVPLSAPHEVPPLPDLVDRIDEHELGWGMFDPSGVCTTVVAVI